MNILTSPWLPVALPDGALKKLAPLELPFSEAVRVAHPRADFSALATELLVDLFQTYAAPADLRARMGYLRQPETVDLTPMKAAASSFELLGTGTRFMQSPSTLGNLESASSLVFETPRGNTLKKNTDLFVARNEVESVCPHCAPLGLYLNQAHARVGGNGYFTTCRGGSALTVLVRGSSLWETVVLNLLLRDDFDRYALLDASNVLPWSAGDEAFTAATVKPAIAGKHAVLWWCPVALHLVEEANGEAVPCGLCGEVHPTHIKSLYRSSTASRQPAGLIHPRTAWGENEKTKKPYPLQVPEGRQRLEDWLAVTLGRAKGSFNPVPAVVALRGQQLTETVLWTFGCQMDNMTMERWYDEVSPVVRVTDAAAADALRVVATELLERVSFKRDALRKALTSNLADNAKRKAPLPLKQDAGALLARFEATARDALLVVFDSVDPATNAPTAAATSVFDKTLSDAAFALFERNTVFNPTAVDQTRRILMVRKTLANKLYPKPKDASDKSAAASKTKKAVAA